ncbi:MAG: sialidase family protein [Anaerolineae bacterium]
MPTEIRKRYETLIAPAGPGNPRNGEGAIVALRDGRLLLAWTHFTGGGQDHAEAEIWARVSRDGGRSWDEPYLLQENIGACNVMSVGFLRAHSGELLFGFLVKNHPNEDCHYYVRHSVDEGETWGEPILATPEEGYFVVNNDRLLGTPSGRMLVPAARSVGAHHHALATCFASGDGGHTWARCAPYLDLPGDAVGLQEPGLVACADGSLWMVLRTGRGCIYASRSLDEGETWSTPEPTSLIAPVSPASAKRLPGSDQILILYNDRRGVPYSAGRDARFQQRTPLAAAVSADHGRTWRDCGLLEADLSRSYCYTSIAFHGDETLLTYYVGTAGGPNLVDMKLAIVPAAAWSTCGGAA